MRATPLPPTLATYERQARARPDPTHWAYVQGAAGDGITLARNSQAWQDIDLRPRVLRSVAGGHTRTSLLGHTWPTPLLVAPMAYQRLAHPHGESGMAMAAAAQGVGMVLSALASETLEAVAQRVRDQAGRGPLWFQLYWQCERERVSTLVRRAEDSGYDALVLTVDAPLQGVRDAQREAGFRLPASVAAVNLPPSPGDESPLTAGESAVFDRRMAHAPTWAEVAELCDMTRLPVLLKGITHPEDARLAQQHGAAGIIVSNHGGRVLDTVPATATLLRDIVHTVGDSLPVLVDGGIRRGSDVFKALALGASAVLVGRAAWYGLACAGAEGAAHVLRLLRDELEATMALSGCARCSDVRHEHIAAPHGQGDHKDGT